MIADPVNTRTITEPPADSRVYSQLNQPFQDLALCQDYANNSKNWLDRDDRSFVQIALPQSLRESCSQLNQIMQAVQSPGASFLRMSARTFCEPHTDFSRRSAINILLTANAPATTFWLMGPKRTSQHWCTTLDYEVGGIYLLNVAQTHAVINRDQERIILSVDCPHDYTTAQQLLKTAGFL